MMRVSRDCSGKSNAPRMPQPRPPAHRVLSLVLEIQEHLAHVKRWADISCRRRTHSLAPIMHTAHVYQIHDSWLNGNSIVELQGGQAADARVAIR
jgi:hypothetical protein